MKTKNGYVTATISREVIYELNYHQKTTLEIMCVSHTVS